jgi:hypothetical protein
LAEARTSCTTQFCTMASDNTSPIAAGRPFKPSQATMHIGDAAVAQLGQHAHPVLSAFAAGSNPQPDHVAFAFAVDGEHDVDRPVGDLPVADLDSDALCVITASACRRRS